MYEELKDLLVSELLIDAADIKPESELVADLGISSVDLADLVCQCEDKFGIEIDDTDMSRFVTVKDIVDYLEEKKATDYKAEYEKLVFACGKSKVCALAEVGYNPDVDLISSSKVPWAYYMTWSKEFAMDGVHNTENELCRMYSSDYTVKL